MQSEQRFSAHHTTVPFGGGKTIGVRWPAVADAPQSTGAAAPAGQKPVASLKAGERGLAMAALNRARVDGVVDQAASPQGRRSLDGPRPARWGDTDDDGSVRVSMLASGVDDTPLKLAERPHLDLAYPFA